MYIASTGNIRTGIQCSTHLRTLRGGHHSLSRAVGTTVRVWSPACGDPVKEVLTPVPDENDFHLAYSHTSNRALFNSWLDRPFTHLMPSGGGTLLFVITSTPSIVAELLGSKLLAVNNSVAVDFSNFYILQQEWRNSNKKVVQKPAPQEGLCGLPGQSHCQCDLHRCTEYQSMESLWEAHWTGPECEGSEGHQTSVGWTNRYYTLYNTYKCCTGHLFMKTA